MRVLLLTLIGVGALATTAAVADPPERVGRIAYLEGAVSLQPPQAGDWTEAFVNFPVAEGEGVWTGDNGRAELQIGAVEANLDNETELDVSELRYGGMRLAVAQGSASILVTGNPGEIVVVATPAGEVRLDGSGFYRIDVGAQDEQGGYPAELTVLQGHAEAPGPGGYTPVGAGQAASLYAGYEPQLQPADDTAIDDWSRARFRLERAAGPGSLLPEAISGGADLARYGEFVSTPDFGTVWFPQDVPADWAPYRFGRWVNVAPWGYTWIDDAPWGFAPFHYGRWAIIGGRWGWVPGQPTPRPVYAPALVAFVGGGGWGAEFGAAGAIGWIPLGPGEVYRPTFEASDAWLRAANAADVRRDMLEAALANRLAAENRAYRNALAATVVRADALARGARVRDAAVRVAPEVVARAPMTRAVLPPPPRPVDVARPAAPPPPRLTAVRAAVAAPPSRPGAAPAIAGNRPPPPPRAGAPAARLIAPAQRRDPGAQNREAVTTAAGAPVAAALGPRGPRPSQSAPARPEAGGPTPPAPPRPRPLSPPPTTAPAAGEPSVARDTKKPAPGETKAQAEARARAEARRKAMEKNSPASSQPPPP